MISSLEKTHTVLSIAGSDPSGGAGIQADLKTISACGCYGATVITALTAQNTIGVDEIFDVPAGFVANQLKTLLDDIEFDAVKIGMLHHKDIARTVASYTKKYNLTNVVLDPVMVSSSGKELIDDDALSFLKRELIPLTTIITPNIPEAEILLGYIIDASPQEAAVRLSEMFGVSVLLKGGHGTEDHITDVLYDVQTKETITLSSQKITTNNTHGTGCTLSSALASYLGKGENLSAAFKQAHTYTYKAIQHAVNLKIGKGNGPLQHFWQPGFKP